MRRARAGQAVVEFALTYSAVILPLTFMTIFVAQALWIWHGMVEFTRDGARYASTHYCGQTDGTNVVSYMQSRVPAIVDQAQFQAGGSASVQVQYNYAADLDPSACDGCIPDSVTVSVTGYTYGRLAGYLRLPGITMPTFTTNLPMESAGYDSTGTVVCQ